MTHERWGELRQRLDGFLALMIALATFAHLVIAYSMPDAFRTRAERAGAPPRFAYVADLEVGYRLRENARWIHRSEVAGFQMEVRIDGDGQRASREESLGGILVAGDSFAFGWGVEEADVFAGVARRELERRLQRPVPLHVVACPGHGLDAQRVLIARGLKRARPDVVLWCGFLGDDLELPGEEVGKVVVGGHVVPAAVHGLTGLAGRWAIVLPTVLESRAPWWRGAPRAPGSSRIPFPLPDALAPELQVLGPATDLLGWVQARHRFLAILGSPSDPRAAERRERLARWARTIHQACQASGAQLVMAPIPPPALVDDDFWTRRVGLLLRGDAFEGRAATWTAWMDCVDAPGAHRIDLRPLLVELASVDPIHLRGDGHWRSSVHRRVGLFIAERLEALLRP